jgi:hypothetical protein
MNLGERGRLIGLITALAESDLYRYSNPVWPISSTVPNDGPPPEKWAYSTKDSLGLFQQRPTWWFVDRADPIEKRIRDLMDSTTSAELFYREMVGVPNWRTEDPWIVAQRVQRSEYTDGRNYRNRMASAEALLDKLRTR